MEKYERLAYLESRYTGEVWLVENKETKELFAVKFIKRGPMIDENVLREIMIHKSLRHPNIIQFKEVVLSSSHLGIVMEYAEGGDLHDKVSNTSRKRLNESQGVCHRDVKPGNILLDESNPQHLKNCDFGYSKSSRLHSKPKSVVGTLECRAPEVGLGEYNDKARWTIAFSLRSSIKSKLLPSSSSLPFEVNALVLNVGKPVFRGNIASVPYVIAKVVSPVDRQGVVRYSSTGRDVWSLGVTLYYMLVGTYPHDTPNEHPEYPMITGERNACPYYIPSFLSTGSKMLLTRVFVENPEERITIEKIMENRWYKKNLPENLAEATQVMEEYPSFSLQRDEEIVNIVKEAQSLDANGIQEDVESWEEEESGDEEDVESGKEEEDEN